ncbi:predicted protein [Plenodomus lingam JN3]|uniref:Uncharacterized protein n=1 Tax=Leptosphaeria maculans (strain JN3 / isolate v23.1.3 / race Av1-4-5-6-7-8) TaxID=985895 RepID=E5A7P4_LEPMJ|nr:predicted protein [Plenodomus lingam JN3]CBX99639.1 predicted protein [Plenodomus lingam JN3]
MSYEHEPASSICESLTNYNLAVAPASFAAFPASSARPVVCPLLPKSPSLPLCRCGVTAICVAAIPCLAVVRCVLDICTESHSLVQILHGHSAGGSVQTVLTTFVATSSCRTLPACPPELPCGIYHQTPIAGLQNYTLPNLVTGFDPITLASPTVR